MKQLAPGAKVAPQVVEDTNGAEPETAEQQRGRHPDIRFYLRELGIRLRYQTRSLTLELVDVLLSLGHDTPPAW